MIEALVDSAYFYAYPLYAMPPGRYWSVVLMDAFTSNFAVIGQRCEGTGPVALTVAGPAA